MLKNKNYDIKYLKIGAIVLTVTVFIVLSGISLSIAGNNGDMTIQSINPVPELNQAGPSETRDDTQADTQVMPNDQGIIDRIAENEIVIDDILYKFSSPGLASGFKVGDHVRFIRNRAGMIVRLEKIKKVTDQN